MCLYYTRFARLGYSAWPRDTAWPMHFWTTRYHSHYPRLPVQDGRVGRVDTAAAPTQATLPTGPLSAQKAAATLAVAAAAYSKMAKARGPQTATSGCRERLFGNRERDFHSRRCDDCDDSRPLPGSIRLVHRCSTSQFSELYLGSVILSGRNGLTRVGKWTENGSLHRPLELASRAQSLPLMR